MSRPLPLRDTAARPTPIYSVSEITRLVKRALLADDALQSASHAWVAGEISNFKRHTSGHLYFTLKDDASALRCVMFRGRAEHVRFRPENGMAVLARGEVSVYERDGAYQLYVEELEPHGAGALHVAFEQLKARLASEGLFDPARKRPLPLLPRRVGLVTSPTGAAVRDIISVSLRRFPNAQLVLAPVLVQGPDAPGQIAAALGRITEVDGVDVVIVGRGGGSLEELWAFNDEQVARAIHRCPVPVVSAVGHETDFTIADFVADVRAPTPSAAAELVWPDKANLQRQIAALVVRLQLGLKRRAGLDRERLAALRRSAALARPAERIHQFRQRVDDLYRQLERAMRVRLAEFQARRDEAVARLDALSPLAVLARGYSLTRVWPDGPVVRSVRQADPGQTLGVRVRDGELVCAVQSVTPLLEDK